MGLIGLMGGMGGMNSRGGRKFEFRILGFVP